MVVANELKFGLQVCINKILLCVNFLPSLNADNKKLSIHKYFVDTIFKHIFIHESGLT